MVTFAENVYFANGMGQDKLTSNLTKETSDHSKYFNRTIVKNTLFIFLPISIIIMITAIIVIRKAEKLEMKLYRSSEISVIDTKLTNIETHIEHAMHDLLIFAFNNQIEKSGTDYQNTKFRKELAAKMLNMVIYQKIFDQLRFIDENGMEVIRINFNNGSPEVVPKEILQNKKDRYYFKDAIKLGKGEIFISPMDLNIENGKIEEPHKPMIRIATPVFDKQNVKRGIIIFNFFANKILEQLHNKANTLIETQLMLLNKHGYLLKGPNSENEWGFMYDDKKNITFSNLYANSWDIIANKESSQFETEEGLFTFKTIYPLLQNQTSITDLGGEQIPNNTQLNSKDYYWKIVSFIPHKTLYSKQKQRRQNITLMLVVLVLILLFMSWKLAKTQYSQKKALQSLEISNQTKDKFFSIIAHDLRGPFNTLLGYSELLMDEMKNAQNSTIKDFITIIDTTLNNTYKLLLNLLDWSRSQTNQIEYKPESFLLDELVDEIFELQEFQAENKEITMNKSVPENLTIIADRNMLNTVLRNLLSNAIKYSNMGGKISFSASVKNTTLYCAVSDNGVGMSKEQVDALFALTNTQSRSGTNNEKGTGLGLIICKQFIERHKGKIGIESKIGKGSSFWFEIPYKNGSRES